MNSKFKSAMFHCVLVIRSLLMHHSHRGSIIPCSHSCFCMCTHRKSMLQLMLSSYGQSYTSDYWWFESHGGTDTSDINACICDSSIEKQFCMITFIFSLGNTDRSFYCHDCFFIILVQLTVVRYSKLKKKKKHIKLNWTLRTINNVTKERSLYGSEGGINWLPIKLLA